MIRNAKGAVINRVRMVLSIQMTKISGILIGISVDKIQGIDAEKKRIEDTHSTPIINLVIIGVALTRTGGKNISAISTAAAFAANIGSGI